MTHNWIQTFTIDDIVPNEFKQIDYQWSNCQIEVNHYYMKKLDNIPACIKTESLTTNHQFKLVNISNRSQTYQCIICQSKFTSYANMLKL